MRSVVRLAGVKTMQASALIGRVGGLAVALGVGLLTSGVGVAWASPTDSTSPPGGGGAASTARGTSSASGSSVRTREGRPAAVSSGSVGELTTSTSAVSRIGAQPMTAVSTPASTSRPAAKKTAPAPVAPRLASTTDALNRPAMSAAANVTAGSVVVQSVTAGVTVSPLAAAVVSAAPTMDAHPAPTASELDSVLNPLAGSSPLGPATESGSWVMLAAARRELGVAEIARMISVARNTTRQLVTPEVGAAAGVIASAVGASQATGGSAAALIVTKTIVVGRGAGAIAASPDGKYVYVANSQDNSVSVINAVTNTVAATIALPAKSMPSGIAVSPNGKTVYVANTGTNTMSIIDAANNTVTGSVFTGPYSNPSNVLVSPDGATVYVNNSGTGNPNWLATVSVIDAATNRVTKTIRATGRILSLAVGGFSPDGKITYVVSTYDDLNTVAHPIQVGILNTASGAITSPVTIAYGRVGGVAVNPVNGYIYAGIQRNAGYPPSLVVINPATMKLTARINTPFAQKGLYPPWGVAVSADGNSVFVTNVNAKSISVISPDTSTVTATIPVGQNPTGIAVISSAGGNIYVTNRGLGTGNTVSVIRTT